MNKSPTFSKGTHIDTTTTYVVNKDVILPSWVKCCKCGKGPTPTDWLKPVNSSPTCRKLIHLSHIPDGPNLSQEAGWIARNT